MLLLFTSGSRISFIFIYLYPCCRHSRCFLFHVSLLFSTFPIFYKYLFLSPPGLTSFDLPFYLVVLPPSETMLQSWSDLFSDYELLHSFLTRAPCIRNYVLFLVSRLGTLLFKPTRSDFMKSGILLIAVTEQCQGEKRKI